MLIVILMLLTETPDLLFEVASLENTFQVGGFPWHYIVTPNKKSQRGIFHVCSLKDHTLVICLNNCSSNVFN